MMRIIRTFATQNILFFSVLLIILSVSLTYFWGKYTEDTDRCPQLPFIDPKLDCVFFETKMEQMASLQSTIGLEIKNLTNSGKAERIGVFVRDFETQRFVGVNENYVFDMASLYKVPLAIAYFKYAEVMPEILKKEVLYQGKPDLYSVQEIQPSKKLTVGEYYSTEELIRRSLVYSDNSANEILASGLTLDFLNDVFRALNIRFESKNAKEDLITPKAYANIFRILFTSSYLTREYSNQVLSLLTESDYKNGAMAKLPSNIQAAHKFGEREIYDENGTLIYRQLHDCGLVYLNKTTYSFCIMTQGKNMDELQKIIQDISLTIYNGMK